MRLANELEFAISHCQCGVLRWLVSVLICTCLVLLLIAVTWFNLPWMFASYCETARTCLKSRIGTSSEGYFSTGAFEMACVSACAYHPRCLFLENNEVCIGSTYRAAWEHAIDGGRSAWGDFVFVRGRLAWTSWFLCELSGHTVESALIEKHPKIFSLRRRQLQTWPTPLSLQRLKLWNGEEYERYGFHVNWRLILKGKLLGYYPFPLNFCFTSSTTTNPGNLDLIIGKMIFHNENWKEILTSNCFKDYLMAPMFNQDPTPI